ncbi:type IV pilus assembly protein PilQ [Legionella beliardensis]|uniref:Type IV pilus assembly protein PilQ n=1 Tax=Legionella beliardensis TaxID=91822 RepID=A0A378I745_9GAMM|nr:type IV pilus secretin PilQ family protein [Legionella beliardensis]STX28254.1 type IV pilus assembly protein PilQ [Legionella beliardensis]
MHRIILVVALLICFCNPLLAQDNTLVGLKVTPLPNERVKINFIFAKPITTLPTSFITQKPARLVLDFANVTNQLDDTVVSKKINLGALSDYTILAVDNRLRAVFNLSTLAIYSGYVAGKVYTLTLSGKTPQVFEQRKEVFITNRPVKAHFTINNIDFRGTGKQAGRAIIDVSSSSVPVEVSQTGREVVINFISTRVPGRLMKRYDVADFQSPAQLMTLRQVGKNARLVIKSKGDYGHFAYQVNKQLFVDIFPLTAEEIRQAKLRKQVYTGKSLSLNFQDISIRAVLQLLADFSGFNIIVSNAVEGKITLRLHDVPWDQALDIILKTNNLDKRQTGNIIFVAPAKELLDREKAELKSQQEVVNLVPLRSELLQLNFAKAADIATLLKDKNTSLLSKRGSVSVDERTNMIWIQDVGEQIERVRELIKQLDIPVKQVQIEARIVNVTREAIKDLGVRFGVSRPPHLSGTLEGANQLAAGVPPAEIIPLADRLNVDLAAPAANPASIGIALAKLGDDVLLDLELSALESEDKADIIASPRLMTTNQQSAMIESGEEIPYQEATSSGATAVAFKKAVLSLKVTPQITPDNKILMDLQINQDAPSGRLVNGVPAILTKQIQTNVLVNNGQTVVLGGIYRQDKNNTINRVPFLGELPGLGILFRNKHSRIRNEELLIFITPRIITDNLSIMTVNGQGVGLDKFGKPIAVYK